MEDPNVSATGKPVGNPFRYKRERMWLVLRLVAAGLVVALLVSGSPVLAWLAVPVLVVVWLSNLTVGFLYRRNAAGLPCLDELAALDDAAGLPGVTIISPARNEAEGIEAAVRSLAQIDYPRKHILAVNDHSTDETGAILDRLAAELPEIQVLHDPPRQDGWLGKANAIWQAVAQIPAGNEWLLLTDADVVHHPKALRRAVALAEREGYDFLTCVPHLQNGSLVEECVLTPAWAGIIISATYDRLDNPSTPPIGVGAFSLVRRRAYLESGGHAEIRDQMPEDALLAQVIRKWGGKVGVAWTRDMLNVRLYRSYAQLRDYSIRKARVNSDDSLTPIASTALFWLLCQILPLPLAMACAVHMAINGFSWGLLVTGTFAALAYLAWVKNFRSYRGISRFRRGLEWLHPVSGLLRSWIHLQVAAQILLRRPMDWRGRHFAHQRPAQQTGQAPT